MPSDKLDCTESATPPRAMGQTFSRIFSGLPAIMRSKARNRSSSSPPTINEPPPSTVVTPARRLSIAPPSFLMSPNARRRASLLAGGRRQLSRRTPRRESIAMRRGSKCRRRSSIKPPPLYMLTLPVIPPYIQDQPTVEESDEDEEKDDKSSNSSSTKKPKISPLRRLSRIMSNAGPALVRKVSQIRRKSVALVEKDPELDDIELTPARYRPIAIDQLSEVTKFSKQELQYIYRGFKQECPSGVISEETFKAIYCKFFPLSNMPEDGTGRNTAMYAHYVFGTMDVEGTGHITFGEFIMGLSVLLKGSLEERLNWAFNLYDINNDGYITKEELVDIASSIYDLMGDVGHPHLDDAAAVEHVERVFDRLDLNKDGVVTIDEFTEYCSKNEEIVTSLNIFDLI